MTIREKFKAMGIVHSEESKGAQEMDIIGYRGYEELWRYEAITPKGIHCTAIFNVFTGLYYADDIYGKVEIES